MPEQTDEHGDCSFVDVCISPNDTTIIMLMCLPHAGCLIKADIFFVLDVSGSVTGDFNKVVEFEREFVNNVTVIGPNHNRIGTVVFNDTATTLFNLNTYENKSEILRALSNLSHDDTGGTTNIVDGLCHLIHGFSEDNGARPVSSGVMRIVIVITDGRSNSNNALTCNLSNNTAKAAEQVHEQINGKVYVIGITNQINETELLAIATEGEFTYLETFNRNVLIDAQQHHIESVCEKGKEYTLRTCLIAGS